VWTPFANPWKGEPEFEGIPESLCRGALQQAVESRPHLATMGSLLGFVLGGCASIPLSWFSWRWWSSLPDDFQEKYTLAFASVALLVGLGVVRAGVAIGTDLGKARALRAWLGRCRCPKCRYQLMGIPIRHNGLGVPQPGTAVIRCPECGFRGNLLELGLTPNELIPFRERVVPSNIGEFHRRYRPNR